MKQIVSNYSYSPATNVVTLTGVNIDADQLLLIVAPQVGRTLYNFASVTGVVSAGADTRVTLNASTAGLTTTSPLVIFYDDQASTQTVAGTVTANVVGYDQANDQNKIIQVTEDGYLAVALQANNLGNLPISGTVTANLFGEAVGGGPNEPTKLQCDSNGFLITSLYRSGSDAVNYDPVAGNVSVNVKNVSSVTIGSVPNGSLTTRFGTPTTANTAFATSAVTNANRKYLLIQNVTTGSNVITVGIGFTPTTTQGIQLTAGAGITFESSYIPTGAVQILSSVTASNFTILEA